MRKPINALGKTEIEVLNLVLEKKEATVASIHEEILKQRKTAYTTIMTVMKNLTQKGYLKYRKDGVTYVYSPTVKGIKAHQILLENLMEQVFNNSPLALMQTLVKTEYITQKDKTIIETIIQNMDDENESLP